MMDSTHDRVNGFGPAAQRTGDKQHERVFNIASARDQALVNGRKDTTPLVHPMRLKDYLRKQGVALDLWLSRRTRSWESLPLLHYLHRDVTADIEIGSSPLERRLEVSVVFQSPYLHLPVEVSKSQIGESVGTEFKPAAFRLFDWHTWAHIDGRMEWRGERLAEASPEGTPVVRGFRYQASLGRFASDSLGLRIAEGVDGVVRILVGNGITPVRFQPQYWILDPRSGTRRVTPIRDTELAMLLVSLSELCGGSASAHEKAVDRLAQWAAHKKQKKSGEQILVELLMRIRDWGPTGEGPMCAGIKELLQRLDIAGQERILFEFYAENWGVRNNPNGRKIAINLLRALATKKALFTLEAILEFVRNQAIPQEEVNSIEHAIDQVAESLGKETRETLPA